MMLELTGDEARAVAETLRRTITSAERGAARDLVAEQQHLARIGRWLSSVLDKLERPRSVGEMWPRLCWIMVAPDDVAAVVVHRETERAGMLELGYREHWSATVGSAEQACAWLKAWWTRGDDARANARFDREHDRRVKAEP